MNDNKGYSLRDLLEDKEKYDSAFGQPEPEQPKAVSFFKRYRNGIFTIILVIAIALSVTSYREYKRKKQEQQLKESIKNIYESIDSSEFEQFFKDFEAKVEKEIEENKKESDSSSPKIEVPDITSEFNVEQIMEFMENSEALKEILSEEDYQKLLNYAELYKEFLDSIKSQGEN